MNANEWGERIYMLLRDSEACQRMDQVEGDLFMRLTLCSTQAIKKMQEGMAELVSYRIIASRLSQLRMKLDPRIITMICGQVTRPADITMRLAYLQWYATFNKENPEYEITWDDYNMVIQPHGWLLEEHQSLMWKAQKGHEQGFTGNHLDHDWFEVLNGV